tara:strand:+ start:57 stop:392 length:336 start_codon:yes stop_codon:yes gene_type:complete
MVNKKAFSYLNFWVEAYAVLGFVIGLILSIIMRNIYVLYVTSFVCGFILSRIIFLMKSEPTFPFYLISITTLIGFVLGAWITSNPVSIKLMSLIFIGSIIFGHYMHKKGYL